MENNFLSSYSGAGAGDASSSSFDPMFSGVSLQSILSLNPSVFSDCSAAGLPASLAFLADEVTHSANIEDHMAETKEKKPPMVVPKSEPCLFEDVATSGTTSQSHPFDFFSNNCPSNFYDMSPFHLLPQLHSMESLSFSQKRRRFDSLVSPPHTMAAPAPAQAQGNLHRATVNDNLFAIAPLYNSKPSSSSADGPVTEKSSPVIPQSNLARQRRQKLSDKTRCLQKLMPWDKKMDQATLLEEAYKYVKFLQAQFNALQSMPSDSPPFPLHHGNPHRALQSDDVYGDLERLNRNQVLQVLVNSPVAQTMLYSQGYCVFSVEQLTLLNNISGRKLLLQQMMSDNASSKAFFD